MKGFRFLAYNVHSASCKALRDGLRSYLDEAGENRSITRHPLDNTGLAKVKQYRNSLVPCWGAAKLSDQQISEQHFYGNRLVNVQAGFYSDKKQFLRIFKSDYTVPWTDNFDEALKWVEEGQLVVARMKLNAHSGEGIVLVSKPEEMVAAPLYTKYIKKESEFRLHVNRINNDVVIQQKRKKIDAPVNDDTFKIRNLKNGWVYTREDVRVPDAVHRATQSIKDSPHFKQYIDFCALDVIYNKKSDSAYVLEMNLAPGLAGQTVRDYAILMNEFHKKYFN